MSRSLSNINPSNINPASNASPGSTVAGNDIATLLALKLIGQPAAISAIVPCVQVYRAMLSPDGRPAGIFLLLGPSGTGKTKTVEALADVLHGSPKKVLKVDCGEFQMDHEVAKLTGAPPGYLGHRETQPMLSQQKLNNAASAECDLSIVLFDEIEKAAPSMTRLLLGVLDKATLRLGDNSQVNFEKSIIFLTSNLGTKEMHKQLQPDFGFEAAVAGAKSVEPSKMQTIGMHALRKTFSPEFINRLDAVVTYQPLDSVSIAAILDQQIRELQDHLDRRLGDRAFRLDVPPRSRRFLLEKGISKEYGARELKRTLERLLIHPLAFFVAAGDAEPGAHIRAEFDQRKQRLAIRAVAGGDLPPRLLG
jgi:ATP-dependent Clp protease ATP-binding subunit ClpA